MSVVIESEATCLEPSAKKLKLSSKEAVKFCFSQEGPKTNLSNITLYQIEAKFEEDSRIYEYTSAANPYLPMVPVRVHASSLHESGATRIIPFDLSGEMGLVYAASSPNLMASFIRICANERINTDASATSQAFYIIRGAGRSASEHGEIEWSEGDLFVLPACENSVEHISTGDSAIYWVHDQPLLQFLGVKPCVKKFNITLFRKEKMLAEVERIKHQPGAEHRNRMGILLGNKITEDTTKTLTHTLWSLLNVLPAGDAQRPHRHKFVSYISIHSQVAFLLL